MAKRLRGRNSSEIVLPRGEFYAQYTATYGLSKIGIVKMRIKLCAKHKRWPYYARVYAENRGVTLKQVRVWLYRRYNPFNTTPSSEINSIRVCALAVYITHGEHEFNLYTVPEGTKD